jgi:hypothetical protein
VLSEVLFTESWDSTSDGAPPSDLGDTVVGAGDTSTGLSAKTGTGLGDVVGTGTEAGEGDFSNSSVGRSTLPTVKMATGVELSLKIPSMMEAGKDKDEDLEMTLRRSNPLVRSTNKNQEENSRIQKIKVQGLERMDL